MVDGKSVTKKLVNTLEASDGEPCDIFAWPAAASRVWQALRS